MARPQVADEGNGLYTWRVAANILNEQSLTADKGWSSSWRLGRGLTNPRSKKLVCYEMLHRASVADCCEHGNEPSFSVKSGEFLD
jgi:hypothetical protein